ncbi:MAG: ABC transporter permease, partial [Lachnospiraceae bacterium]|nr:ABC transporter permease [Lachnospiraceae bacterium]
YWYNLDGDTDRQRECFDTMAGALSETLPELHRTDHIYQARESFYRLYGSLFFVGIFMVLLFLIMTVMIIYYKQITEGYEDRDNFTIMQKVGMSDEEIRDTVHRQIFMVFGLPLLGALMHTAAGMFMVKDLFAVLSLFDIQIIAGSSIGVSVLFAAVYGISYLVTAKTYYRIVKQE